MAWLRRLPTRRPRPIAALWWLCLLGLAGCGAPVDLETKPCPCLESAGFVCCADSGLCVRRGAVCAQARMAGPDAAVSETGSAPDRPADGNDQAAETSAQPAGPPPCGNGGQSCCPGNRCLAGGCCLHGSCVDYGDACGTSATSCVAGSCALQGGIGQACWQDTCTAPGAVCTGGDHGTCVACGGRDQPCCMDGTCAGPSQASDTSAGCNFGHFLAHRRAAAAILVLDRSSAMGRRPGDVGPTLWEQATGAIWLALGSFTDPVRWGLKLAPSTNGCLVTDGADVPVDAAGAGGLLMHLNVSTPAIGTATMPLAQALLTAIPVLEAAVQPRSGALVVLTDGQIGCPSDQLGQTKATEAVQIAASRQIPTFIVATAATGSQQDLFLRQLALQGRVPFLAGANHFVAQNQEEMRTALTAIVAQLPACTFEIDVPAANEVAIEINGQRIPHGQMGADGWDWGADPKTIEFHTQPCTLLRGRPDALVEVIYGCPGVAP